MSRFIGVDIEEIERIRRAVARWGEPFLKRVYTSREIELYAGKVNSLAARFAGKEAVIKALRKNSTISLNEVEIISDAGGRPLVNLYGAAEEQARKLGICGFAISLSHTREYAVAFVSGE